jgi:hypothetical protein
MGYFETFGRWYEPEEVAYFLGKNWVVEVFVLRIEYGTGFIDERFGRTTSIEMGNI